MSAGADLRRGLRRAVSEAGRRAPILVDAYRLLRRPRAQLAVIGDVRITRHEAAFLADRGTAADRGRALVVLYRDDVFETKSACLLSAGLARTGVEPLLVVPHHGMRRIDRYAAAFGLPPAHPLDAEVLDSDEARECDEVVRSLQGLDFEQVRQLTFRGHQIGNHVLSTVVRITFDGDPNLDDPPVAALTTQVTHEVATTYLRAEHLFERLDPALVLVEEANYSRNGPVVDVAVARAVDVVQTQTTWRDDAMVSKRLTPVTRRVDAKSVDPAVLDAHGWPPLTPDEDRELEQDFTARYGGGSKLGLQFQPPSATHDVDTVARSLGVHDRRPTAVVFSHVLWDASLFFGEDLFANYGDWLVQTVAAAIENPQVTWVVKAHPANAFRAARGDVQGTSREVQLLESTFPSLPDHVRVVLPDEPVSTLAVYRLADLGITVRGTPGLEMACFGKQVVTGGTGHYSGLGFTTDSACSEEYLDRLRTLHRPTPLDDEATARARRYAHALFCRRPWPMRSARLEFRLDRPGWRPLDRNLRLRATSWADVDAADDLLPWARWATGSAGVDYRSTFGEP